MNGRTILTFVVVVALAVAASAMCDKWGVRKCSKNFENCTQEAMDFYDEKNKTDPICDCFQKYSDCISKYDCDDDAAVYVFHSTCMMYKNGTCGTKVCRESASSLAFPVVALLLSAVVYLFF